MKELSGLIDEKKHRAEVERYLLTKRAHDPCLIGFVRESHLGAACIADWESGATLTRALITWLVSVSL